MKVSRLVVLGLLVTATMAFAQARPKPYVPKTPPPAAKPAPAAPATPAKPREFIGGIADTGQFLPDTTLLAVVGTRSIRVSDYVTQYFNSYPEYRPRPDDAGRIEFLNNLINKEVLAQYAVAAGREFGFEERLQMRTFTQRVLSNEVYRQLVVDSVNVTEEQVRAYYETQLYDQHFRHILFADRALAAKVAADLRAKRITWEAAFRKYHAGNGPTDLGWLLQTNMPPEVAVAAYGLPVGAISEPIQDRAWYHVFQSLEHRPRANMPAYESIRRVLKITLQGLQTSERAERIQTILRARIGMVYDTAAVVWMSTKFGKANNVGMDRDNMGAPTITINDVVPEFSPADTGRVLARWKGGQITVSPVLRAYTDITPVSRPMMNTPEAVQAQVDALVLEPYMAEYAVELGLDKAPSVLKQLQEKREEILVKHMFGDSVESRVWISKEDRRKYYNEHPADFTTFPTVTFAALHGASRAESDSLAKLLRQGVSAASIIARDSLAGITRGTIQTRTSEEHGAYHKLLFEELRPGQITIEGPDHEGGYAIIQSLSFDSGKLLPFEQVEGLADESLQNIRAEESLNRLIERAKKKYPVVAHKELLPKIKLVDPTLNAD